MNAKILKCIGIFIAAMCLCSALPAQSDIALETRKANLLELAERLRARDAIDRGQVETFAKRTGIPVRRVLPNGRIIEFQRFAPGIGPVIYVTYNLDAADTVSTDEVWPGGTAGLDLDGNGMTVGEWDGGAVAEHPDFDARLIQMDTPAEVSNHSTHVAGTLIGSGDGNYLQARGMAYAANLHAYDWNSDTAEMAAAAASGLLVSNHSYGIAAGWLYMAGTPPDQWWWIGGNGVEDPNFGYYDAESHLWDQIAVDAPYYLIVKASGNDRSDFGAAPGEQYTVIDQQGNFVEYSTQQRNPDCAPAGYDCLPGHSVAKNILTIGAVDDLLGGYSSVAGPAAVNMTDFSSWGPTDDGRIKPDLVGNGVLLFSTYADYPYWASAIGTSMAAPNVSGSLLLLQEHYQDLNGANTKMRAATLKALAIHSADETGNADGPDYAYGWGLLNTKNAAEVISEEGSGHLLIEDSLPNSGLDSFNFTVSGNEATLTATLVWADPPGTVVPPSLDPPDLMLVNDLDLRISKAPVVHKPWILDPTTPSAAAIRGDNVRDNVEQVYVESAAPGTYIVEVSHKGTLLDGVPQEYSLIISEGIAPTAGSAVVLDEDFEGGMPAGWSLESTTSLDWKVQTPDGSSTEKTNYTGGTGKFAILEYDYVPLVASLVTPSVDLSDASGAVLSFRNYFTLDLLETLNVDVSTDGGASWTQVWEHCCSLLIAFSQVLDLSGVAAGNPDVMVRFRYDSEGLWGWIWQLDDVRLEKTGGASTQDKADLAHTPSPADGAKDIATNATLSWTAGAGADSHAVYFGTDPFPAAQGNQPGTGYGPGVLDPGTTYYWRIDEVNDGGTRGGNTWSFTTADPGPPDPASTPNPADGAVDVTTDATLTWAAGAGAESHDVYFGTNPAPGLIGNQPGASYDPGALNPGTVYYWRVDEVNGDGTTAGGVWSFTTVAPPQETLVHLSKLEASSVPGSRDRWTAGVTISVKDQGGAPVAGVLSEGTWSDGAKGDISCTTGGGGQCIVQKANLKSNVSSVTFTLNGLTLAGAVYDSGANEVGEVIVVPQDAGSGNLLPVARNDSFVTTEGTPVSGNVMDNDDVGEEPTGVTVYDSSTAGGASITMSDDGTFTYTPQSGFTGDDSFAYTIEDGNGDVDSASVTVTVNAGTPPPPPAGLELTATPVRIKGVWNAQLNWSGHSGAGNVSIRRGGAVIVASTANDGDYLDEVGKKPASSYTYEVCEVNSGSCATDTVNF